MAEILITFLSRKKLMTTPDTRPRTSFFRIGAGLTVCFFWLIVYLSQQAIIDEYWFYFTEDRPSILLDYTTLSEEWSEQSLYSRFAGANIRCSAYADVLPADRACVVDMKSLNGLPALFMSFFFQQDRLQHVSINIPRWAHRRIYRHLVSRFGLPAASESSNASGTRLHGWKLENGAAVFANRDTALNPILWSSIYWRSASGCRQQGCFNAKGN